MSPRRGHHCAILVSPLLTRCLVSFKAAVSALLERDAEADLTYMVADYLTYSTRIQRA